MPYLYAIGETSTQPLPQVAGIGGKAPEALPVGGVTLVLDRIVSLSGDRFTTLCLHQKVVEAVMATRPVLPFRFGTQVSDLDEVAAAIWSNLPAITGNLRRVAGCVELGLVVGKGQCGGIGEDQDRAPPSASNGRDYLTQLVRRDAERRAVEDRLTARFAPLDAQLRHLSRSQRQLAPGRPRNLLRFTYLVPIGSVPRFRRAVAQARQDARMPSLFASGPWPPYSFVDDGLLSSDSEFMAR